MFLYDGFWGSGVVCINMALGYHGLLAGCSFFRTYFTFLFEEIPHWKHHHPFSKLLREHHALCVFNNYVHKLLCFYHIPGVYRYCQSALSPYAMPITNVSLSLLFKHLPSLVNSGPACRHSLDLHDLHELLLARLANLRHQIAHAQTPTPHSNPSAPGTPPNSAP
jgi:hypothetical protein